MIFNEREGSKTSTNYKAGDRVLLVKDKPDDNYGLLTGHCGTVVYLETEKFKDERRTGIGVSWDDFQEGWSLYDHELDDNSGWVVQPDFIVPLSIDADPNKEFEIDNSAFELFANSLT